MSLKLNVVFPGGEKLANCTIEVPLEAVGVTEGQAASDTNQERINNFAGLVTQTLLKAMKGLEIGGGLDTASLVDCSGSDRTVVLTPGTSVGTSPESCSSLEVNAGSIAEPEQAAEDDLESRMPRTLDLATDD
ncbi:hypothetical protein Tdes44962_MAKER03008 [Teratosphaeria destructans]|uniref:Uncharacterized protein n=1 Tax=Teratosphaeria destructans TaxID=418781 RepID=A0A9W7W1T8_9PEZI|nr:hypothetical protein Tdes44962_MAKER03008 [Teratosphaeria destructans]